ncbi:MAG: hypothetical protein AAB407_00065 [Patescibacteria group bacterium]
MHEHRILINITSAAAFFAILLAGLTFGFISPTQDPPTEQGVLRSQGGNIGINTSLSGSSLTVLGGASIGSYATTTFAPPGTMYVEGKAGIGEGASVIKGSLNLNGTIAIGRTIQFGSWDARFPINEGESLLNVTGGRYISMTIGSDGFPVMAYYASEEAGIGAFRIVKCNDVRCTTYTDSLVEASGALTSADNSLVIGSDNRPVFAYNFVDPITLNTQLKVAKCSDIACMTSIKSIVDPEGYSPSIRISPETGNPVLAYYRAGSPNKLVFRKCNDAGCSDLGLTSTIQEGFDIPPGGVIFGTVSMGIGYDGLPVMSYYASTTGSQRLRLAKCNTNYDCLSFLTKDMGSSEKGSGYHNSLTIGLDGLPVISTGVRVGGLSELRVLKCLDISCTASTSNVVDSFTMSPTWNSGEWNAITLGINGFPVISYIASSTAGSLNPMLASRIAVCSSSDCSSGKNTLYELEQSNAINFGTTVAIGSHGIPIVAYRIDGGFKLVTCGSDRCLPYWTR